MGDKSQVDIFMCGPPKDHKCDDAGPYVFGLKDGSTTDDEKRARKEGCTWGSVTCSICGMSAMDRLLWEGP